MIFIRTGSLGFFSRVASTPNTVSKPDFLVHPPHSVVKGIVEWGVCRSLRLIWAMYYKPGALLTIWRFRHVTSGHKALAFFPALLFLFTQCYVLSSSWADVIWRYLVPCAHALASLQRVCPFCSAGCNVTVLFERHLIPYCSSWFFMRLTSFAFDLPCPFASLHSRQMSRFATLSHAGKLDTTSSAFSVSSPGYGMFCCMSPWKIQ